MPRGIYPRTKLSDEEQRIHRCENSARWRQKHPDAVKASLGRSPSRTRIGRAIIRYPKIPAELLLAIQDQLETGPCDSCGKMNDSGRSFHIDHNHETGTFRGVLCQGCNIAAGALKDSPEAAQALAVYLKQRQSETN